MSSSETMREQRILRGYDPVREEMHWKLIYYGVCFGLMTAYWLFSFEQQAPPLELIALNLPSPVGSATTPELLPGAVSFLVGIFLIPSCLIVGEVIIALRSRKARARILRIRKAALEGTARVCLPPSMAPLPVTLPHTIHMSVKYKFLRTIILFFSRMLFYLLPIVIFSVILNTNNAWHLVISLFTLSLFVLLLPLPIWYVWNYISPRWGSPTLTLNDESITAYYGGDRVMIYWASVRFFAIIDRDDKSWLGDHGVFELSDGEHVIRWFSSPAIKRIDRYMPLMDFAQYESLMQALPHWICTRTGLPLYDLYSRK